MEIDGVSLTSLINELNTSDDIESCLQDIRAFITCQSSFNLKEIVNVEHVKGLLGWLSTDNKKILESSCIILSTLLSAIDPLQVILKLWQELKFGLLHQKSEVQEIVVKELNRVLLSPEGPSVIKNNPDVLKTVITLVGNEDLSVSKLAVKFLKDSAKLSPVLAKKMLGKNSESLLKVFETVMGKSDVVRYRVYEIICSIQSESEELLDLCLQSGILDRLLKEISSDDPLLKVTCIAMITELASSPHSLDYLEQSGLVSQLLEFMKNPPNDPISDLYLAAVVEFFGHVCMYRDLEKIADSYSTFLRSLFLLTHHDNYSIVQVAMDTIGLISKSTEGKFILYDQGSPFLKSAADICKVICGGPLELKENAVNALAQMLSTEKVYPNEKEQLIPITLSWFQLISSSPVDTVLSVCKHHSTQLRMAGFKLLNSIVSWNWGIEALVEFASITEYLLDRKTESESRTSQAKFWVIKTLANSPKFPEIFGAENFIKFKEFLDNGVFYSEPRVAVATQNR